MKRNNKVALTLAVAILSSSVTPAVYAASEPETTAPNAYALTAQRSANNEVNSKLSELKDAIDGLDDISGNLTGDGLNWLKQLKNAYEFVKKLVDKGLQVRERLVARIDLLTNVAETITADATELADSEQQAHVIIGFSVTRTLLKGVDVFASTEDLNKASEDLKASLENAREVPKQTEDSIRTHYNIEQLNIALNRAIDIRNHELKGKLDPDKLAKVDLVIRKAKDVRRNARATVGEVKEVIQELNETIDEAYNSIDPGDRTATNKTKLELENAIDKAKNLRDFKLKGNVDSRVIAELNRNISKAIRVLNNNKATVNEVVAATENINAAMEEAKSYLEPTEDVVPPEEDATEDESTEVIPEEDVTDDEITEVTPEEDVTDDESTEVTPEENEDSGTDNNAEEIDEVEDVVEFAE